MSRHHFFMNLESAAHRPRKRVLISVNASWNIYNFRAGLVQGLSRSGYDVVAAAPLDGYSQRLRDLGCQHIALPMDNKGSSPVKDALLFLRYMTLFWRVRPDVFLGYTVKPNIYGSLAARLFGIPVINNISGLGTAFIRETWLTRVVKLLYRIALRSSRTVFFQNRDDRALFLRLGLVREEAAGLLPGSGINLDQFRPAKIPAQIAPQSQTTFLLVARLIWDKGVKEYVEAARLVKRRFPKARFQILGFLDVENRGAISRSHMNAWVEEGLVEYLGTADDVRPFIAAAGCVVSRLTGRVRPAPFLRPPQWPSRSLPPIRRAAAASSMTASTASSAQCGIPKTLPKSSLHSCHSTKPISCKWGPRAG